MTAKPAPRQGWETLARPAQVNQRRYEAVRAYVLEGAPLAEASARFGYTPSALASLVRDFRAGKLALFADPGRPSPSTPTACPTTTSAPSWPPWTPS